VYEFERERYELESSADVPSKIVRFTIKREELELHCLPRDMKLSSFCPSWINVFEWTILGD